MGKKSTFASDQPVRWCPGCGDYAILATIQRLMPKLDLKKENTVFVSGIGCASRFPYYIDTYGMHTIHGRAPAVVTGLKMMRPDLNVWMVTGDGDGLSIGVGHLLHLMRRNVDVNILLLNNAIYGLTKGQYSPTSAHQTINKATPRGSFDRPLNPVSLALSAGCTFVARGIDVDAKGLNEIFKAAMAHKGTSFIEIFQNCHIYNDGIFAHFTDKAVRQEKTLWLKEGQPMRFGEDSNQGLIQSGFNLEVVNLGIHPERSDQVLEHTSKTKAFPLLEGLARLDWPVVLGIFRQMSLPTYESYLADHTQNAHTPSTLKEVLHDGAVWTV